MISIRYHSSTIIESVKAGLAGGPTWGLLVDRGGESYTTRMFNQKILTTTALVWLPLAIVFTGAVAFAYGAVQQNYRQSLNDPQVQVVAEAAKKVANGEAVTTLVPSERIDLSISLSPFIIFYDANGEPILGSGVLNGVAPTPPSGVFAYTKTHGEDRITWQPQPSVRIAAVIKTTASGFVLSGRSMREVENRIYNLGQMAAVAWLFGLGLSLGATLWLAYLRYQHSN